MGDLLQRGTEWLAGKLQRHASREVVYRRGDASVSMLVTVGKTLLRLSDGYGGTKMQWTDRDYIFTRVDLFLDGALTLPQAGDTIEEVIDGTLRVFEVLSPGTGEPHYKLDPHERLFRVHTKERI